MKNHFRVVVVISMLLIALTVSISVINFLVSLKSTKDELASRSLPLSVDNIYSEIQSHIIEPSLVSSMMANDTFVRDWLMHEETDQYQIKQYLERIKHKYGMFVTFLVSEKTLNYYTHNGFLETITSEEPDNQWYFRFRDSEGDHEINLDTNSEIDNSLFMFMNYKIFDRDYQLIGVTGIGHKVSYVDDMLKRFRQNYKFNVYFINQDGKIVLSESLRKKPLDLSEHPVLGGFTDRLISLTPQLVEYEYEGHEYLIKTKYIPELEMYLLVEANISDFTKGVQNTFYFNLIASSIMTLVVTFLVLLTIRRYNRRLEVMASSDALTGLMNRRAFELNLKKYQSFSKRAETPLTLVFFDLDNFKAINDQFGHHEGDRVLKRVAALIRDEMRKEDVLARWGGEEFILAMMNTSVESGLKVAEKLRIRIERDLDLYRVNHAPVTASFGVSECSASEAYINAIVRVDKAMYESKRKGKNRVTVV